MPQVFALHSIEKFKSDIVTEGIRYMRNTFDRSLKDLHKKENSVAAENSILKV